MLPEGAMHHGMGVEGKRRGVGQRLQYLSHTVGIRSGAVVGFWFVQFGFFFRFQQGFILVQKDKKGEMEQTKKEETFPAPHTGNGSKNSGLVFETGPCYDAQALLYVLGSIFLSKECGFEVH